jgi:hypothetical protein
MIRIVLVLIAEAICQAVQPVVGNVSVYSEVATHDERRAEAFIMPTDGTIAALSIYQEGGGGRCCWGFT